MPQKAKITKKRSRKIWKIDELRVSASKDKDVTWDWNGLEFVVWFPPDWCPLDGVNQSGRTRSFTAPLKPKLNVGEVYPYSIFCYDEKEMAEGGSGPEMIIDP